MRSTHIPLTGQQRLSQQPNLNATHDKALNRADRAVAPNHTSFTPADIHALQRTLGNQTVNRLLAKTTQNQATIHRTPSLKRASGPNLIQRMAITHAVAGPVTQQAAGKDAIDITCTMADTSTETFTVTVSTRKHVRDSYTQMEVTTPFSGLNTNTIALIALNNFQAAFQEWGNICAQQLQLHGSTWDPSTLTHMTTEGISFGSDSTGNTHTIHSFPVGGLVTVLTDPQYDELKDIGRAYYGHGNYQTASNRLLAKFRANDVATVADITTAATVLGLNIPTLRERLEQVANTTAYMREEDRWSHSFLRGFKM